MRHLSLEKDRVASGPSRNGAGTLLSLVSVVRRPKVSRRVLPVEFLRPWLRRLQAVLGAWLDQQFRRPTVTVSMEDGLARVVVVQRRVVVAWGSVSTEATAESSGWQPAPLAPLRTLLRDMGVSRGRVVTDLPISLPIVRHLRLPKIRRRYLEQVILSEVLESIPFPQGAVDIRWQVRRSGEGQQALAMAVPREIIDGHVHLLHGAGVRPRALYARAQALAHAVGLDDGIVVYLRPAAAAIVLLREGTPQVVHQVELPGHVGLREQVETVALAVDQVAGYDQTLREEESPPLAVALTGPLAGDTPLAHGLAEVLPLEARPLALALAYPEHFHPAEYAVNLGLALADATRRRALRLATRRQWPSFNLLSERHLPRSLPIRAVAAFVALLLFGSVALNVAPQVNALEARGVVLGAQVAELERQERLHRLSLARARQTEASLQTSVQMAQSLSSHLAELQGKSGVLLARLDLIVRQAGSLNIKLSGLDVRGDTFALAGKAPTHAAVFQYTAVLRSSGLFAEAVVLQVEGSGEPGTSPPAGQSGGSVSFNARASAAAPSSDAKDGKSGAAGRTP